MEHIEKDCDMASDAIKAAREAEARKIVLMLIDAIADGKSIKEFLQILRAYVEGM